MQRVSAASRRLSGIGRKDAFARASGPPGARAGRDGPSTRVAPESVGARGAARTPEDPGSVAGLGAGDGTIGRGRAGVAGGGCAFIVSGPLSDGRSGGRATAIGADGGSIGGAPAGGGCARNVSPSLTCAGLGAVGRVSSPASSGSGVGSAGAGGGWIGRGWVFDVDVTGGARGGRIGAGSGRSGIGAGPLPAVGVFVRGNR